NNALRPTLFSLLNPGLHYVVIPPNDVQLLKDTVMKSKLTIPAIVVILMSIWSMFSISKTQAQGYAEVSFGLFYDELAPHGYWYNARSYGDSWFSSVSADYRPYSTNGHWVMTEYGNTSVSNYSWGWASFHYGRWVHVPHRGCGCIPGYEWAPAWVECRLGNGYYGWAQLMLPVGVSILVGIPINFWRFAPSRHIYSHNTHRTYYSGRR